MHHKHFIVGLMLMAMLGVVVLGACAAPTAAPTSTLVKPVTVAPTSAPIVAPTVAPARVKVLRLPGGGDWGYPSPFGFSRGPGYTRAAYIFDTLAWRDSTGQTIPWLAKEWKASSDGLTWTFTLRDGVKWHDGKPLTVDDVVFSFNYLKAKTGAAWFMSEIGQIESVTKVADNQIAIKLVQPFAPFLQSIAETVFIFPKHIWEKVDDPKKFTTPEAVIGSGPYKLVEYNKQEGTYLFEANRDYFLGEPYVQRIEFIPVSDSVLALANGKIDAFDMFGGATDEMLAPFAKPPFQIKKAPGEWGMNLYFNLANEKSALKDVRVRQAIAYAINRKDLVERILFNFGEPGHPGFLPPANQYHNPNVPAYVHDLAKAKALLDEAGYKDDGKGTRKSADGTPLQIALTYSTSSGSSPLTTPRILEMVTSALNQAGIQVKPVPMDQASLDAAAQAGNYEAVLLGFGGLGGDPDMLRRYFASTSKATGFSRARGYKNAEFDALAAKQVTIADFAERKKLIDQMQVILAQDLPVLPLYYTARVVVFNAQVFDNWYYTPGGHGGGIPMPYNKHQFVTGVPAGLTIRGTK